MNWSNFFGFPLWMCSILAEENNGVVHPEDPTHEETEKVDETEEGW